MPINIIRLEEAQRSLSLSPTHRIEKIDGQILNSSKKFLKTLRILKNCHRQIKFSSTSYIIVRNNKFFFKIPINKEKRVFISVRWLIKNVSASHYVSYYFFTLERIRWESLASYFVDATGIHATIRSSFSPRTFPSLSLPVCCFIVYGVTGWCT